VHKYTFLDIIPTQKQNKNPNDWFHGSSVRVLDYVKGPEFNTVCTKKEKEENPEENLLYYRCSQKHQKQQEQNCKKHHVLPLLLAPQYSRVSLSTSSNPNHKTIYLHFSDHPQSDFQLISISFVILS
jgi:hypothetical protein